MISSIRAVGGKFPDDNAALAQLVELLICNQ